MVSRWTEKPLGELFDFFGGISASRAQLSKNGYPYLHYGDIHGSSRTFVDVCADATIPCLDIELTKISSTALLHDGDIVFVDASEDDEGASRHVIIRNAENKPFISGLHTIIAREKTDELDNLFKEYCFQTEEIKAQFKFYAVGTKVIGVNKGSIAKINLRFPTEKAEQYAIAEALSDTDNLIASLEKLIGKKKAIKHGAMQELITGKRRLPGFSGEWIEKALGECFEKIVGGGTPSRANSAFWGGTIPWMTVKDFATFNGFSAQERITKEGLANSATNLIPQGTPITSTRMGLGRIVIYNVDVAINQDLKALFIAKDFDTYFIVHWFTYSKKLIESVGTGSTVKGIRLEQLCELKILVPPTKAEQTAIASTLSDMESEIEALERKLAKYRRIKQGMMQELLTGRIRLIESETTTQTQEQPTEFVTTRQRKHGHNEHFHEAVVLSAIVAFMGDQNYPLGRFRRQKFAYLLHRHAGDGTEGFLKKAAGPYNPTIRYTDEGIAIKSEYVVDKGDGRFVKGAKSDEAVSYFAEWYGDEAREWLMKFRFRKNDDLEVLTTVAEAITDLKKDSQAITVNSVKSIISSNKEWAQKLSKPHFSDVAIKNAMLESERLFGKQ